MTTYLQGSHCWFPPSPWAVCSISTCCLHSGKALQKQHIAAVLWPGWILLIQKALFCSTEVFLLLLPLQQGTKEITRAKSSVWHGSSVVLVVHPYSIPSPVLLFQLKWNSLFRLQEAAATVWSTRVRRVCICEREQERDPSWVQKPMDPHISKCKSFFLHRQSFTSGQFNWC